jgi:hypothetical protein
MTVMITAITPSVNASIRPLCMSEVPRLYMEVVRVERRASQRRSNADS